MVQLENQRPQALALFVFATAFAATAALIGLADRSFLNDTTATAPLVSALESALP